MHYFMPSNIFWVSTREYFKIAGLGLFIFISGLLIDLNYSEKIKSLSSTLSFYKNRLIRIMPLNWLAIIVFVFFTFIVVPFLTPGYATLYYPQGNVSFSWLLPQFVGLQLLLTEAQSFTSIVWFVGLVVILYLIYPILISFSKNIIHLILISFLPLFILGILRLEFGLIDDRLFWFYMVFIGGIIANRMNQSWKSCSFKKMSFFLITCVIFSSIFFWDGGQYSLFNIPIINFIIRETVVMDIAIVSGCVFLLSLLSRANTNSVLMKYKSLITFVSVSSFCVYLFHIEFFTLGIGLIDILKLPAILTDVLFYIFIIPVTIIFSYYIQINEERILDGLKRYYLSVVSKKNK
jgi:peptidoglycan/LPS O-acetylase OafA/YrhL